MTLWHKWVTENPVFRYHFWGQTRFLVRQPVWQVGLITAIFLALYIWFLRQAYNHGLPVLTLVLEGLLLWIISPLMTHSLFAAEFEKATWDMLILTRLTAGQIVLGKFLSRLAILLFLALFFVPPLLIGASQEYHALSKINIASLVLKTQLVVVGWSILLIAVTICLSYWLKRGMFAAAVAFAGQVFVLFILPILWGIFFAIFMASGGYGFHDPFSFQITQEGWLKYGWMIDLRYFIWFYNPIISVVGILVMVSEPDADQPLLWGTWQGLVYISLTVLIVAFLTRKVAKATRKPI
ncbi:MAG: hypothetical protein NZ805_14090 [Armatimonadetes bacterium]|nr:hypothetical protein [Armatimonadota bacterium]MDW8028521.1 hypothetical protein [Armatimonadota bacterium]